MSKNRKPNATVIFFHEGTNEISVETVVEVAADTVETNGKLLSLNDADTYVDSGSGKVVYVFNGDIPARIESEKLKTLRRSTALKQMFNFERGTGEFDLLKWAPYVIILLLIVFK